MREKIINAENNRFRLITGTFPDKETAEIMAEELKIRYGWIVYIIPEQSENRFVGFMDLKNMKQVDGIASYLDDGDVVFSDEGGKQQKAHFIQDTYYNVISVHDFPMIPNQDWTHLYPA